MEILVLTFVWNMTHGARCPQLQQSLLRPNTHLQPSSSVHIWSNDIRRKDSLLLTLSLRWLVIRHVTNLPVTAVLHKVRKSNTCTFLTTLIFTVYCLAEAISLAVWRRVTWRVLKFSLLAVSAGMCHPDDVLWCSVITWSFKFPFVS